MNITDIKIKEFFSLSVKKILEMYLMDFIMLLFAIGTIVMALTILIIILKEY